MRVLRIAVVIAAVAVAAGVLIRLPGYWKGQQMERIEQFRIDVSAYLEGGFDLNDAASALNCRVTRVVDIEPKGTLYVIWMLDDFPAKQYPCFVVFPDGSVYFAVRTTSIGSWASQWTPNSKHIRPIRLSSYPELKTFLLKEGFEVPRK